MRKIAILLAAIALMGSTLACCITTNIPDITIDIKAPTLEVGPLQETEESIPLDGTEPVAVDILFGAGELEIQAGEEDELFSGRFKYNVKEWEPEISYDGDLLVIRQGSSDEDWGIPTDKGARNEWDLAFSPEVPLEIEIRIGAGEGEWDFGGLQLEDLDIELGAGDFAVYFGEPNEVEMRDLDIDAGASKLQIINVGNASPKRMAVRGGVGDITLELTGDWANSASIDVTTGVGSLTLRVPDNMGVRVDVEGGLSNIDVSGLHRSGDDYVNDDYGEAEMELDISVNTGVGQVNLIEVPND